MPIPSPVIRTERLELRRPTVDDAEALFSAYASDPDVTRFLRWAPKTHPDELRGFLESTGTASERGDEVNWVLKLRKDRSLIGMFTVWLSEHGAELGLLFPVHSGDGAT